jgi:antitoxin MazE
MDKIEAKIIKHGNSQAITLNKEALYKAGFDIGDILECHMEDGKLVFQKKEVPSFKEKIQDFYRNGGMYHEPEVFDERSTGRELW